MRGLTVRFGTGRKLVTAVDGVDLKVARGQTIGLVGESGSGKSTLARAVAGLAPAAAGQILVDGKDLSRLRGRARVRLRRRVQLVFQDPYSSLDPRMTVGESVAEGLAAARRRSRAARTVEVARLLGQVALDAEVAGVVPGQLSGGQRQRVALARALAAEPTVLVADEITSALDVSVQGAVLNLVRQVQRDLGLTLVLISHNLAVVRYVADAIAVMYCGRVVEVAPTDRLVAEPQHPYTRALLEAGPRLEAAAGQEGGAGAGDRVTTLDGDPPDPHDPPAGCRFHPRCPVGPRARPEREVCREADPSEGAGARTHRAACFFPASLPLPPAPGGSGATPPITTTTRERQP
ncbi:MAG: ABC transporter ATP-binding protein [Acidimicrobiales bacterium]